ncbi:hypothetical protein [Tropicimonas sp.]|uniref:hypothetical protein n=1 Tax=Tropicimonas sp. TaxID=2067044 RepID=UPI003A8957F8
MDGYGHFWRGHLWMLVWWSLACVLIWLIAWGCHARGVAPPPRIGLLRERLLRGRGRAVLSLVLIALALTGGAVIWQSMVLHRWPLFDESHYMAEIEKRYRGDWGDRPQPRITAISGQVDLYPEARRVEMRGEVTMTNMGASAIGEVIVFFHPLLNRAELALEDRAVRDAQRSVPHVQIWRLNTPLAPGEAMRVPFRTESRPDRGFALHSRHDTIPDVQSVEILGNGSSILNLNLIPAPGYSERFEHKPAWLRRMYGLPPEWTPPLSGLDARTAHDTTHLGWVEELDITVSTSAGQIPLHAGEMVGDLGVADGRRSIRYRTSRPVRGWAEIMSARYDIHVAACNGLPAVELYHHPPHDHALEPMADALLDAMAYFQSRYGPPPFETFRMAESSLHYTGFGARGGLAFVSEVMGWKSDLRRSHGEDLRKYAADLMGVSWWLDQIMPANLPGAKSVLSGLPYWTSALYLHRARGPALSREMRLLDMKESYRLRARLEDAELPFAEEMKDSTMIRTKGALHVVYLAELVGQERLEAAFAGFLDRWRFRPVPYPSAADLVAYLKAKLPATAAGPIDDFFAHVSNWRLRVLEARAWPDNTGGWKLHAVVDAGKWRSRGLGDEEEAPLDTPLPLVAFGGAGYETESILRMEWLSLPDGRSEITWSLRQKPQRFGIDPYLFLPDSNPHDNVAEVRIIAAPKP